MEQTEVSERMKVKEMTGRIRELTLYPHIRDAFSRHGWKCEVSIGVEGEELDVILRREGVKVASEVKIDAERKLTDAIVDAGIKGRKLGTRNTMAILFPRWIREADPSILDRIKPKTTALVYTDWLCTRETLSLDELAELLTTSYQGHLEKRTAVTSYDFAISTAREAIREMASFLRSRISEPGVIRSSIATIGRFDAFRSLLRDYSKVAEEEIKLYTADITSYLVSNQLLFYHILSERLRWPEVKKLPDVDPLSPSKDLLDVVRFKLEEVEQYYPSLFRADLMDPFMEVRDRGLIRAILARMIYAFRTLRPHNIRGDLFGRLYQETIPPETRKNLGAFYTNPVAAKLLATLAVDKWNLKVLDPACGSGSLLVESYRRKMELAPREKSERELHRKFLEEDIYGIDIMQFAKHMTSVNLSTQNMWVSANPSVYFGDGVEMMGGGAQAREFLRRVKWKTSKRMPTDFDLVIMNPPFTRRERIPKDLRAKLEKLVPEVKGKTGYWAHFIVVADKVLGPRGTLAVVIPEEFFVGRAAESVRSCLLKEGYELHYVIRSAAQPAFSEETLYRDYLLVLRKKPEVSKPLIVIILKKKLEEIGKKAREIGLRVKKFSVSLRSQLITEDFEALKVYNSDKLILEYVSNLKPLVGFNTISTYDFSLDLTNRLKEYPTLQDLEKLGLTEVRLYRPGQHKEKGVEGYAQKLFISRYGGRSPNVRFLLDGIKNRYIRLRLKKHDRCLDLPLNACVRSLRTYSMVKHIDITDEEEFAIIDLSTLPQDYLEQSNLIPFDKALRATQDIKSAYEDLAGNILLTRRIQLTSPGAYWLAFYSNNRVLGSQLPSVRVKTIDHGKVLCLYLNSMIALLQLISFTAESRGAWVSWDHRRVWSHIHVPDLDNLKVEEIEGAIELFSRIGKQDVEPLLQRVRKRSKIQREIDEFALEIMGLTDWREKLDNLYDSVLEELKAMDRIMKASRKVKKKPKAKMLPRREQKKAKVKSLTEWFPSRRQSR